MVPEIIPNAAFFLDIDGTILEFAERPDAVEVDDRLKSCLRGLLDANSGAIALISGRRIDDIDRLFDPIRFPAAGQHGIERRDGSGRVHRLGVASGAIQRIREELVQWTSARPGLVLEDKGLTLALHYRQAPEFADVVAKTMTAAVARLGEQFETVTGKMVVEIKPSARNKGTAIADYMQERPFKGRIPVFIGDDATDEYGFEIVNRLQGQSVKVGPGHSRARARLRDAGAVRDWLQGALDDIRSGAQKRLSRNSGRHRH